MEKINELAEAKKISLDMFTKKKLIIIFFILILVIASAVLIWGYAFQGFLYQKLKKLTTEAYTQLVIKQNTNYIENDIFTDESKSQASSMIDDLIEIYDADSSEQPKFLPIKKNLSTVESITTSKNEPTFVVTDLTFKDKLHGKDEYENIFSNTIWFIFEKVNDDYKINEIIYKLADVESKTKEK